MLVPNFQNTFNEGLLRYEVLMRTLLVVFEVDFVDELLIVYLATLVGI